MDHQSQPPLSVCIPTFNRAEILRETLDHLADTLDPSCEIVVSNNNSSDHTEDVLEEFKNKWSAFRYATQTTELTATQNSAAALCMARGRYCYSFSDDDRLIIDGISKAISLMDERQDIVGVFGSYQEWLPKEDGLCSTIRFVDQLQIFAQGSKLEMFDRFNLLWSPVMRTEECLRFCVHVYDRHSPGYWPFISRMLDHGAVAVTPDLFYKHAHTEPRGEYDLTEGWCHDKHRTQFEVFLGQLGCGSSDNINVVAGRTNSVYLQGVRFATIKKDWLTARNYLFRARAYGLVSNEELIEWEQAYLMPAATQRIKELIQIAPNIRRIIIESSMTAHQLSINLPGVLPETEITIVNRQDLLRRQTTDEEFIIAWDYETLKQRSIEVNQDPLRQCAMLDIFDSCRVSQVQINYVCTPSASRVNT